MSNILTPISLWKNFNDNLPLNEVIVGVKVEDGIKYEYVKFEGRDTGAGRVIIYGVWASDAALPSEECVFVIPDSIETIDEALLKAFVKKGYSCFSVDYRGEVEGVSSFTNYPVNVYYANTLKCGRYKDFVDESAEKTTWYEWVAVCRYAYKFITTKVNTEDIAVVGIRDGGEIAWKLITSVKVSCAVTVCAAGWKAYEGYNKFGTTEPVLNDERYRFIAGIDSQAYAPYVQCPVLMLCSVNDKRFDYDRAFDTFSRINEQNFKQSVISYSVDYNGCIGLENFNNMFMFLDKYAKGRHVYLPKPSDVVISVDENDNLVADVMFDELGSAIKTGLYMAEDCKESALREWTEARFNKKINDHVHRFYLDVYKNTTSVYALCYATHSSGFTVWSKIAYKKISGNFRNMQNKCRIMHSGKNGVDGFSMADYSKFTLGGVFILNPNVLPHVVKKAKGIEGIYSECGLLSSRLNSPKYAPDDDSVLKLDVFCDKDSIMNFTMRDITNGEVYTVAAKILGGVWQNVILESKLFKNEQGTPLQSYATRLEFTIECNVEYAINNVMWL